MADRLVSRRDLLLGHTPVRSSLEGSLNNLLVSFHQEGLLHHHDEVFLYAKRVHGGVLASRDGSRTVSAASTIKVFVLAVGVLIGLDNDYEAQHDMIMMVRHSDNEAATRTMERIGGPRPIERLIHELGMPDVSITEYIPPGGAAYRNSCSPKSLCETFILAANGKLGSEERSRRFLGYLTDTDSSDLCVDAPLGVRYEKTGYLTGAKSSCALFMFPEAVAAGISPYTLAVVVRNNEFLYASSNGCLPEREVRRAWNRRVNACMAKISEVIYWENMGMKGSMIIQDNTCPLDRVKQ